MAEEDFREFVETNYAKLLRIAFLLVGDLNEAEDVLQTTLLSVLPRWRRMDHPEAYVRVAMVNHLIGRWRRRRERPAAIPAWRGRSTSERRHDKARRRARASAGSAS